MSECLVDLMGAPGTLIPADILNIKDTSFSLYPPNFSKILSLQTTYDSGLVYPILGEFEGSSQSSGVENNFPLGKRSSSEMAETFPSLPSAEHSGVGSFGTNRATPTKQLAIGPSQLLEHRLMDICALIFLFSLIIIILWSMDLDTIKYLWKLCNEWSILEFQCLIIRLVNKCIELLFVCFNFLGILEKKIQKQKILEKKNPRKTKSKQVWN